MVWWQRLLTVIVYAACGWCVFVVLLVLFLTPGDLGEFWTAIATGGVPVVLALLFRKAVNYVVNG